jgi:hypothetical protein
VSAPPAGKLPLYNVMVYVPETGEPLCCWEAYEWLSVHPRRTVAGIKRLLGRRHDDPQLAGYLQSVPYPTRPGGDGVVVDVDGQILGASQLAAALLRNARAIAERAFGTTLKKDTTDVTSRDSSRSARMLKRAMMAGLNSTGINVSDLEVASIPVTRFQTRRPDSRGGLTLRLVPHDPQQIEIRFFDAYPIALASLLPLVSAAASAVVLALRLSRMDPVSVIQRRNA